MENFSNTSFSESQIIWVPVDSILPREATLQYFQYSVPC